MHPGLYLSFFHLVGTPTVNTKHLDLVTKPFLYPVIKLFLELVLQKIPGICRNFLPLTVYIVTMRLVPGEGEMCSFLQLDSEDEQFVNSTK